MLTFNLVGTYKGQHMLCTRSVTAKEQHITVVQRMRNMMVFASNGTDLSFTQMLEIVNEHKEGEAACTQTDNVVWSPKGPLMRTQDSRLHFLRFTQRDSILFAALESPDRRTLVEVHLGASKFANRVSLETDACQPLEADACAKHVWVVTMNNTIEAHNWHDKDSRSIRMPDDLVAKAIMCIGSDGLTAVVMAEHATKHYAVLTLVQLQGTNIFMHEVKTVGKPSMQVQPGTLVQCKGCMIFTLMNSEQQQYLVTVANYKGGMFYNVAGARLSQLSTGVPVQRLLFTDAVLLADEVKIGVVVNRNLYSVWSVNMITNEILYSPVGAFNDKLNDLILDRVVLMNQDQNKLEEQPHGTLLSAEITDAVTARMRQQVDISTNTARAMVKSGATPVDAGPNMKDLLTLRDASETMRKHLKTEHEKLLKETVIKHNAKVLELEQRIADLIVARDARVTVKQHEQLKAQFEKCKIDLRATEQATETQLSAYASTKTQLDTEVIALQMRVKSLQSARDTARAQYDALKDEHAGLKSHYLTLKDKHAALVTEHASHKKQAADEQQALMQKYDALQRKHAEQERLFAEQTLVHSAQLAEARSHVLDTTLEQQVRQLTLQNEASQNRSRIQYDTMQREIDSLRRANYTLSQSYTMLQTITKFNFLPDGTSLDTAMHMLRNLTVFQQDLATARDEASTLRKKVHELEARV